MAFRPKPQQTITIQNTTYTFSEHPAAPGMAYGQTGQRGTVYQIADNDGTLWALKVFLRQYREPRLVGQAERIRSYISMPGLRACERQILTSRSHLDLIREFPDLAYAVVMPWIEGCTWLEIVLAGEVMPPEKSLQLAHALVQTLMAMEERGLAHCDLSGPNIMLTPQDRVELIDLEEMYGPELMKPEQLPGGSPGYAHKTAPDGNWRGEADRFSGAIMIAEMLGWCDSRVVDAKWGEGYFEPSEMQTNSERFRLLKEVLNMRWGSNSAELFAAAWFSDTLNSCPTFTEWLAALPEQVPAYEDSAATQEQPASKEEPDVLAMEAEALVRAGKVQEAIELLERAHKLADGGLRKMISKRLQELHVSVDAEDVQSGGLSAKVTEELGIPIWTCEVCGHEVKGEEEICPYCESGSRQSVEGSGKASSEGQADKDDQEIPPEPAIIKTRIPIWIWLLMGVSLLIGMIGFGNKIEPETVIEYVVEYVEGETIVETIIETIEVDYETGAGTFVDLPELLPAETEPTESAEVVETDSIGVDGMVLVFVPEGTFLMGSTSADSGADSDEFPQHEVYLDGYWIDKTQVTNAMYAVFLNEMANSGEEYKEWIETWYTRIFDDAGEWNPWAAYEQRPVIGVTWYGAEAYCKWAGRSLPTEAEWEKAARGIDGQLYPWGDYLDCSYANYSHDWQNSCVGSEVLVGSYPSGASPYGALDMAGNVKEWVADWYDSNYYDNSPASNPTGPATGDYRVLRGGSWGSYPLELRSANRRRAYPDTVYHLGFRCARSQ